MWSPVRWSVLLTTPSVTSTYKPKKPSEIDGFFFKYHRKQVANLNHRNPSKTKKVTINSFQIHSEISSPSRLLYSSEKHPS